MNEKDWNKIKSTVSVRHHNFLVAEVERLRAEVQQYKDAQAENKKLREMAQAMVKWEQTALAIGEDDVDSFSAFQMGLMLSLATRLAKEVLGEGEVKLEVLKRVEQLYQNAEATSRTLANLQAAAQPVIEQAELDAATRSPYGIGATFGFYEVALTGEQIETLRTAIAAAAAVQINP